jgi:hypothetical protein
LKPVRPKICEVHDADFPDANPANRILACEYIGLDLRAAVGRYITERALYMIWHRY